MRGNKQYRDYLQNINVQSYPSNRNLRIKSQQSEISDNKSQNKSKQFSNVKFIYPKTSKNLDNININNNMMIKNRRQIKTEYENETQIQQFEQYRQHHVYQGINELQLPYDRQQISKNVSKVLSQIQQIQSQFRKLSSQNSLHMKQSIIYKDQQNEQRSNFIQQLMKKIKKPINYQDKQIEYINKQKIKLIKLVKSLNKKLNNKLQQVQRLNQKQIKKQSIIIQSRKRKVKTQYQQDDNFIRQKKNQRTSSAMQFQRQLVQIVEQINSNQKLIQNMKNEFQFHNKKYQHYQNSLKNYKSIQSSIAQLHELIKHKKQQLSRLRKKKFLTQKSIINIQKRNGNIFGMNSKDILQTNCSTSTHSSQLLISLKQQYSQYLKKKQKLKLKIQLNNMHLNKIQQLKNKNNISKQHYEQLLQQMKRYPSINNNQLVDNKQTNNSKNKLTNNINQSRFYKYPQFINSKSIGIQQNQHIQFIYKTKKSKLIMLINTIKRNQQQLKRKYYHLLKQYQTLVDGQNKNYSSPLKQSRSLKQSQQLKQKTPIYKIYQQNQKIIDDKLDKAKNDVLRMQKKIQRFAKIGKIIKKVNQLQLSNNQQNYTQEYNQDFNSQQQYYEDQEQQQTQNNQNLLQSSNSNNHKFNNKSPTKSSHRNNQLVSQSSFSNNNASQKSRSLQKMASASSQFQTPYDQFNPKYDINKDYVDDSQYQRNKKFLTQDQRSYTTQLHQAIDKNSIKLDRIKAEQHKNRAKYIGKFKKQRIIQKVDKKLSQRDISGSKYNISRPIIQEQIQGTSEFDSSIVKNGVETLDNQARIGTNLRREKYEKQLFVPQNINQKEFEVRDHQYISSQIDAQMLQMQRQLDKQQRQHDIKQKYAHILYRSKLFSS